MTRPLLELTKSLPVRIRVEDLERLDRIAHRDCCNRSALMRKLIARGLDQLEAA